MNLDDLQATAAQLAQQQGLNVDEVTKELDSVINPIVKR